MASRHGSASAPLGSVLLLTCALSLVGCRELVDPGASLPSAPTVPSLEILILHPNGEILPGVQIEIRNNRYVETSDETFRLLRHTDAFGIARFSLDYTGRYDLSLRPPPFLGLFDYDYAGLHTAEGAQSLVYPGEWKTIRVVLPDGFPEIDALAWDDALVLSERYRPPGHDRDLTRSVYPPLAVDGSSEGYFPLGVWEARLNLRGTTDDLVEIDWRWSEVPVVSGDSEIELVVDAVATEIRWSTPLGARCPENIEVGPSYSGLGGQAVALASSGRAQPWLGPGSTHVGMRTGQSFDFHTRTAYVAVPTAMDLGPLGEHELQLVFSRAGSPVGNQWSQVRDSRKWLSAQTDAEGNTWYWTFGPTLLVEWTHPDTGEEHYRLLDVSQTTNTVLEIDLDAPQ